MLAAFSAPLVTACGGGSSDSPASAANSPPAGNPGPNSKANSLLVYSSPDDPRIVGGQLASGETFTLVGTKTSTGDIQNAHEMYFIDSNENISTSRFNPDDGRLYGASKNAQIVLSLAPGGGVNIGLLAGDQQVETTLSDLGAAASAPASTQGLTMPVFGTNAIAYGPASAIGMTALASMGAAGSAGASGVRQGRLTVALNDQDCFSCTRLLAGVHLVQAAPTLLADPAVIHPPIAEIDVTGCPGDNPRVFVYMRDETGKLLDVHLAQRTGSSRYTAVLKNLNTADAAVAEYAEKVKKFLETFDITEGMFTSILLTLKNQTIETVVDEFIDKLIAAGKEQDTYQRFIPHIYAEEATNLGEQVAAAFKRFLGKSLETIFYTYDVYEMLQTAFAIGELNNAWLDAYGQIKYNQLQLQAAVKTSKGQKFLSVGTGLIPPEGPYPVLTVNVPGTVGVSGLTLTPSSPQARQNYMAKGLVSCQQVGDIVTISVIGTDGYTDSVSTTVASTGDQSFTLNVPGAASGVNDVVTLQIMRNGSEIGKQTASLIFA